MLTKHVAKNGDINIVTLQFNGKINSECHGRSIYIVGYARLAYDIVMITQYYVN